MVARFSACKSYASASAAENVRLEINTYTGLAPPNFAPGTYGNVKLCWVSSAGRL